MMQKLLTAAAALVLIMTSVAASDTLAVCGDFNGYQYNIPDGQWHEDRVSGARTELIMSTDGYDIRYNFLNEIVSHREMGNRIIEIPDIFGRYVTLVVLATDYGAVMTYQFITEARHPELLWTRHRLGHNIVTFRAPCELR